MMTAVVSNLRPKFVLSECSRQSTSTLDLGQDCLDSFQATKALTLTFISIVVSKLDTRLYLKDYLRSLSGPLRELGVQFLVVGFLESCDRTATAASCS